ncbi:MAG: hypothetical protein R6U51_12695 [Anaerolineales bacterium]
MPNAKTRLEINMPLEEISVNALIIIFKEILVQLVPQMVPVWLEAYQELVDVLCQANLDHDEHLQRAQENVFTFRAHPRGVFSKRQEPENTDAALATSPLEREMIEMVYSN